MAVTAKKPIVKLKKPTMVRNYIALKTRSPCSMYGCPYDTCVEAETRGVFISRVLVWAGKNDCSYVLERTGTS